MDMQNGPNWEGWVMDVNRYGLRGCLGCPFGRQISNGDALLSLCSKRTTRVSFFTIVYLVFCCRYFENEYLHICGRLPSHDVVWCLFLMLKSCSDPLVSNGVLTELALVTLNDNV